LLAWITADDYICGMCGRVIQSSGPLRYATDADGVTRLDADRRPIRQALAEDDNPRKIAMRLALQHFRQQPEHSTFNQPINYLKRTWV
jgi:hypothetical protein